MSFSEQKREINRALGPSHLRDAERVEMVLAMVKRIQREFPTCELRKREVKTVVNRYLHRYFKAKRIEWEKLHRMARRYIVRRLNEKNY